MHSPTCVCGSPDWLRQHLTTLIHWRRERGSAQDQRASGHGARDLSSSGTAMTPASPKRWTRPVSSRRCCSGPTRSCRHRQARCCSTTRSSGPGTRREPRCTSSPRSARRPRRCWAPASRRRRGSSGTCTATASPTWSPTPTTTRTSTPRFDETHAFNTNSLLAVPIRIENSVCGVLEMVNRLDGRPFDERDRALLEIFASYTSVSIQNLLDARRAGAAARSDDLTGLSNDRFFHRRLAEDLDHADAAAGRVALLFMDLDNFKSVNDQPRPPGRQPGAQGGRLPAAPRGALSPGHPRPLRRRRVRRSSSRGSIPPRQFRSPRRSGGPSVPRRSCGGGFPGRAARWTSEGRSPARSGSRSTRTTFPGAAPPTIAATNCCAPPTRRCTPPRHPARTAWCWPRPNSSRQNDTPVSGVQLDFSLKCGTDIARFVEAGRVCPAPGGLGT